MKEEEKRSEEGRKGQNNRGQKKGCRGDKYE